MNFKDSAKVFKEKVCDYCRNDNCERGIVVTEYRDYTLTKCCNFMRKDKQSDELETKEVREYFRDRWKRKS